MSARRWARRSRIVLAVGMLSLAGATAAAQSIAIVGARVHTLGTRGTLEDATVLIDGEQILAVGAGIDVPAGAQIVDAAGKVVTPGIFDAYGHQGIEEISLVEQSVDAQQTGARYTAAFDVAPAINPQSSVMAVNRIEGVTRALVAPRAGEGGSVLTGLGAIVDLAGRDDSVLTPRAVMIATLGERGAELAGGSRALALAHLHEALEDAADFRVNRDAYEARARRDYALSRPDLEALQPVLERATPLVLLAHRASDVSAAVDLAEQFGIRIVIAGGAEAWMVARRLGDAGVAVILDPLLNLPEAFESLAAREDNATLLYRAGVTIAFAVEDEHNARNVTQSAGNAVARGLPWLEALRAITVNPASIFGHDERYGRIEPGLDADLVIWSGDPLEVTTFADAVYIRGRPVPMHSRQTLLRDRYIELDRELPPAYHHPRISPRR